MIVPLTCDEEWRGVLRRVPAWQPPDTGTIVIAPHPDDETLGAGGLIATLRKGGIDVTVVAVTDGENAYRDAVGLAAIRRHEQEEALRVLGVDATRIIRLCLPDRGVALHESHLVDLLLPLAATGRHIVAPWTGDFHPDHEACGRAAQEVARRVHVTLSFYFFWTWHRGRPELLSDLSLGTLQLDTSAISMKTEALRHHRSQLAHSSGNPILPEYLLGPALWPFEVFAAA